jgi:hypothetical protein
MINGLCFCENIDNKIKNCNTNNIDLCPTMDQKMCNINGYMIETMYFYFMDIYNLYLYLNNIYSCVYFLCNPIMAL